MIEVPLRIAVISLKTLWSNAMFNVILLFKINVLFLVQVMCVHVFI